MRGRGVDDAHARALGHRHSLARGIIMQAQNREIGRVKRLAARGWVFAAGVIKDDQREL